MLAATKVKMSGRGKKSEQDHRQHFLHKTRNYRKFHVVVVQSNVKEIYRKSVLQVACLLIRPIVFFLLFSLPSPLGQHYPILYFVSVN